MKGKKKMIDTLFDFFSVKMSGGGKSRLAFYIVPFLSFYAIYFAVKKSRISFILCYLFRRQKKAAFRCCFIFLLIFSLFMQLIYLFIYLAGKKALF
jgi:hypothetical protein